MIIVSETLSSALCEAIMRSISKQRMEAFLLATEHNAERAIRMYVWNLRVSAGFFELLALVEVIVRNAVGEQLRLWTQRSDFGGAWFDNRHGYLRAQAVAAVTNAKERMRKEHRSVTDGALLSALPFGFWRLLLSSRYKTTLWPFALQYAFPNLAPATPNELFRAVAQLHVLRNRIAHHEPILRRDLAADYAACRFVLGAVSQEVADWATQHTRVSTVLAQRP
jgi:hypothetical protein